MTTNASAPLAQHLEPYELTVTREMNEAYMEACGAFHPRYINGKAGRAPLVHPGILLNHSNATRSPSWSIARATAGIHTKEGTSFIAPVLLGEPLRVEWTPAREIIEKRGRTYTRGGGVTMKDSSGKVVLTRETDGTVTTGADPIPPKMDEGSLSGQELIKLLDRPNIEGSGTVGGLRPGLVFKGLPRLISLPRMQIFSGPKKNIHTDVETAKEAGLQAPIASATQSAAILVDTLADFFGEDLVFSEPTRVNLSFIKPVYPDYLLMPVVVVESVPGDGSGLVGVRLWCENQFGTPITVGSATIRV